MLPSKYYVYGGGRWRELDTSTGRVSGWRGARLCVARRGRLVVQRGAARRRVLAALRALAAGAGAHAPPGRCAARDAARLPTIPRHKRLVRKETSSSRCHSRSRCYCCCHNNNNRCEGKSINRGSGAGEGSGAVRSQRSLTSDACIQTAPPSRLPPRLAFPRAPPRPLRTQTTHTSTPITRPTIDTTAAPPTPSKRRGSSTSWKHDDNTSSSSSNSTEPVVNNTNTSTKVNGDLSLKRKRQESNSQTSDDVSVSQSILKKDYNDKYLSRRKSARVARESSPRTRAPRIRTRVIPGDVVNVSSDDENKDPTVNITSLLNKHDTETEDDNMKQNKSTTDTSTQKRNKIQDKIDIYRELVISEQDVDILRRFMIKNNPKFDLYKYDSDDMYKARFFYSINPLVSIEQCPRILAMLDGGGGEEEDELSLQQFASQLGLRSVSEGRSSPGEGAPPRQLRPRAGPGLVTSVDEGIARSDDKENMKTSVRQSTRHNTSVANVERDVVNDVSKMTQVSVSVERIKVKQGHRRENIDDKVKNIDSGDNGPEERRTRRRKLREQQNTNNVIESGRGSHNIGKMVNGVRKDITLDISRGKEYSSLEDHAIVAWISTGERANLVNGNRVWRILERSFQEITGRARSWHSLRNRYLRHLLPTLGRLELPPAQQARLRAAAARGEIKKHPQRRNSIYGEPAVGAASRRPGPPRSEPGPVRRSPRRGPAPGSDSSSPPLDRDRGPPGKTRTPRYSEVTRQFAARHQPPSSSSEFEAPIAPRLRPRSPSTPGPSTPTLRPRNRKLYNPNKL